MTTVDRWNDAFLDGLRSQGDALADDALRLLLKEDERAGLTSLFRKMDTNDDIQPAEHFPLLAEFFRETGELPPGIDIVRVRRGEEIFREHVFESAIVLLMRSLPEGYAAPNLSIILNISGQLETHTFKRLLATLQMVVNVTTARGFGPGGKAVITAQKLRLLHAGVRHVAERHRPGYTKKYGVPVNLEDMLVTIMGFSYILVMGYRTLNVGLTPAQEEDCFYLWRVYAQMMGIHPAKHPESDAYLPTSIEDAALFYEAYKRRHYVMPHENPDGPALAAADLRMLRRRIPLVLRMLGFGVIPHIYMRELMGDEACARIGIGPVRGRKLLTWLVMHVHAVLRPFEKADPSGLGRMGEILFQDMITKAYNGDVTFTVPTTMKDLKDIVRDSRNPGAA
ncbi:MAG TPA: oxygenase MpaB family protein [Bacteroidota bacterium]|nr:oxygenase MpaB family protein [Bacteroidota bacterium]